MKQVIRFQAAFGGLFLAAGMLLVVSCSGTTEAVEDHAGKKPSYEKLKQVSWVSGIWTSQSEEGLLTEKWTQTNDSTLEGKTTFIAGGEVQFAETTVIHQEGDQVTYTATVSVQNDGKPVDFKMTSLGDKFAVFENPTHDFPQKIRYDLKGNSLTATISGKDKGEERTEVFAMERMK